MKRTIKHYLTVALIPLLLTSLTALLQEVRHEKTQAMIQMDCSPIVEHEITALEIREGEIIKMMLDGEK